MTEPSATAPVNLTSAKRRIWIAIAVVVAGLVAANLFAQGLDRAVGGSEPGGATGSSYGTAADGLAAFASLLSHYGHDVGQQRGSLVDDPPPQDATAFVLEPKVLTSNDGEALRQFVTAGGRLVIGGFAPFYLHDLADAPPAWSPDGNSTWTVADGSLGQARDIEAAGTGSWSAPNGTTPLVGTTGRSLVAHATVGRGEIFYLADASPLENAYLGSGDNAAFALALAGTAGRSVVFPEGVHGYGTSRGLGAIPERWKFALALLGVAALAFVWSRARAASALPIEARAISRRPGRRMSTRCR